MIAEKTLQEAVRRIVAASRPTKVILFGSRARFEADKDSDVDQKLQRSYRNQVPSLTRRCNANGSGYSRSLPLLFL